MTDALRFHEDHPPVPRDLVTQLGELRNKSCTRWLGLMSGTSCDGIDAAIVEIERTQPDVDGHEDRTVVTSARVVTGQTVHFESKLSAELRSMLDRGPTASEAAVWDTRIGDWFAKIAVQVMARNPEIDAIAMSGHTFAHHPVHEATLQVGQPSRVSDATGLPVAAAFRTADVARGGEGAPLVPAGDRVLFSHDDAPVAVLNLGGIANVTWLESPASDPVALDCGPANLILDGLWRRARPDASTHYDPEGQTATEGVVDSALFTRWQSHPYFENKRRSTGREEFGEGWLDETAADWSRCSLEDQLATASAWIADSVARAVERLAPEVSGSKKVRILVGGGGAHNRRVLRELENRFAHVEVLDATKHGVSADLREAAAFAILGHLLLHGEPGSFPTTTGCRNAGPIGAWF